MASIKRKKTYFLFGPPVDSSAGERVRPGYMAFASATSLKTADAGSQLAAASFAFIISLLSSLNLGLEGLGLDSLLVGLLLLIVLIVVLTTGCGPPLS